MSSDRLTRSSGVVTARQVTSSLLHPIIKATSFASKINHSNCKQFTNQVPLIEQI